MSRRPLAIDPHQHPSPGWVYARWTRHDPAIQGRWAWSNRLAWLSGGRWSSEVTCRYWCAACRKLSIYKPDTLTVISSLGVHNHQVVGSSQSRRANLKSPQLCGLFLYKYQWRSPSHFCIRQTRDQWRTNRQTRKKSNFVTDGYIGYIHAWHPTWQHYE